MRNPIFSRDTLFLKMHGEGSLGYVSGHTETVLHGGARLVHLETSQPLVRLTTEKGRTLVLSPETVFSLQKDDRGRLLSWMPVNYANAELAHFMDWSEKPHFDRSTDLRNWAIVGMVCAAGTHALERNRPSNLIVPKDIAAGVEDFLHQSMIKARESGALPPQSKLVSVWTAEQRAFIKGRIITSIVGHHLEPKTQKPTFDLSELNPADLWAFFYGFFAALAPMDAEKPMEFVHRSAYVVRQIGDVLWSQFGINCQVQISKMEAEFQAQRTNMSKPHKLVLSAEDRAAARACGLDLHAREHHHTGFRTEKIVAVTPLDTLSPSVIVLPGEGDSSLYTANSFGFYPAFSMPEALVDLAATPEFLDSSDPTKFGEVK